MDKLNKDIISLIVNELEFQDVCNFMGITKRGNKISDHEHSWMNRIIRYYPEAFKLKNKERKWKDYYLQISYYLVKYDLNTAMEKASKGGHKDLVEFFIAQGADYWNWGWRMQQEEDTKS